VKPRSTTETRRSSDLTLDEQEHVRAAVRFLRVRLGGLAKLAAAMGSNIGTVTAILRRPVSAGLALRVARAAKVPLEDVLTGRWPPDGMCPHCGRGGDDGGKR